jgi:hypothetical protein
MAGRPDVKTLMERVRASKERDPIYVSAEQILEYRDEGRRSRS